MANSVIVASRAVTKIDEYYSFSIGLSLVDEDGKAISATFAITTSETTIPMMGITQYGKLIGLGSSSEVDTPFTLTATPVGDDGTNAVELDLIIDDIITATVGEEIGADDTPSN